MSHNKLISRHKVLQAAGKDCRGVLHRPIGQEVCFDIFLPCIIIINNNKTVYSSSSWSEIASPHFSFPSQMVQDRRHRRDRQVWRCQDCRQEEGPGQASIRRVSQHHHRHHIDTIILAWIYWHDHQVRFSWQSGVSVERVPCRGERLRVWGFHKVNPPSCSEPFSTNSS